MSTSYEAKDTLVRGAQLKAQSVSVRCDLVAGTSEEPSIVSVDNSTDGLAETSISIDIKEDVKKIHEARVHDRASGQDVAQTAEASASGSVITIDDVDGTGLDSVTVVVVYEVE